LENFQFIGWIEFKLQNVSLVEDLPLPFHLSMKALNTLCNCSGPAWDSSFFPTSHACHPLCWNTGNKICVSTVASHGRLVTREFSNDLTEGAAGKPNKAIGPDAGAKCGKVEDAMFGLEMQPFLDKTTS
jgi:hypothetical protein